MLGRDVGYGPEHVQTRRHMLGLQGDFTGGTEHRAGLWHLPFGTGICRRAHLGERDLKVKGLQAARGSGEQGKEPETLL